MQWIVLFALLCGCSREHSPGQWVHDEQTGQLACMLVQHVGHVLVRTTPIREDRCPSAVEGDIVRLVDDEHCQLRRLRRDTHGNLALENSFAPCPPFSARE